ncbi:unnamed protein product [Linum trigynum]|uniref:Uncharacterized protein n=1 Tax=Linum trigynum TaxID=586398 RepID=A0AAV2G5P4_9ROSI
MAVLENRVRSSDRQCHKCYLMLEMNARRGQMLNTPGNTAMFVPMLVFNSFFDVHETGGVQGQHGLEHDRVRGCVDLNMVCEHGHVPRCVPLNFVYEHGYVVECVDDDVVLDMAMMLPTSTL